MEGDRNDSNRLSVLDGRTKTATETATETGREKPVPSLLSMPTKKVPALLYKKNHEEEEDISEMDSVEFLTLDDPPGQRRKKNVQAKKVVLEKVEEVVGDKSSAEFKTMESFLSVMDGLKAREHLQHSISRLAKHDSLSDEKTEKFMFMSAFLDCPRAYLLVHVTTGIPIKVGISLMLVLYVWGFAELFTVWPCMLWGKRRNRRKKKN